MGAPLLLDLSRLIWRAWNPIPTGIDRVELAYADYLLADPARMERTIFVALNLAGRIGAIAPAKALAFLDCLRDLWSDGDTAARPKTGNAGKALARRARRMSLDLRRHVLFGSETRLARLLRGRTGRPVYLLVSHHHLDRTEAIRRVKTRFGACFVCLVHDLIPIDFPEYVRPDHDQRHIRRMETVLGQAEGVIVNSEHTAASLHRFIARQPPASGRDRRIEIRTALLGTPNFPPLPAPAAPAEDRPYFLCLGTIEPRKNHLMLLNLWRHLAETEARPPRLILVGRRGWENENVIDMLERCPGIQGLVEEHNNLPDARLGQLLAGACALVLPSFAEGYGLPIAEALGVGVPVLCSDLPSFREVGRDAPEYLDPLDAAAWRTAVLDYAGRDTTRRDRQIARIAGWQAPDWAQHFAEVEALLRQVERNAA